MLTECCCCYQPFGRSISLAGRLFGTSFMIKTLRYKPYKSFLKANACSIHTGYPSFYSQCVAYREHETIRLKSFGGNGKNTNIGRIRRVKRQKITREITFQPLELQLNIRLVSDANSHGLVQTALRPLISPLPPPPSTCFVV